MIKQTTRYGMGTQVRLSYGETVAATKAALATEGFGVLCEIDIAATLKKKLDVDFRPYVILGACNPPLAHRALQAERDIGLLLPCNVIVYAADESGQCQVTAMDPVEAMQLTDNEDVRAVAGEVRSRLRRVLEAVERDAASRGTTRDSTGRAAPVRCAAKNSSAAEHPLQTGRAS